MKKLISLLLSLIIISYSTVSVFALPTDQTGKITVIIENDGVGVEGVKYKLFKIADFVDGKYEFKLNTTFKDSGVVIDFDENTTNTQIDDKINTLISFIKNNSIDEDYMLTTTSDGKAVFNNLPEGLYLLIGVNKVVQEITGPCLYEPQSTLVALPSVDNNVFSYDVNVVNKYNKEYPDPDDPLNPFTKLSVVKKFSDAGYENNRPSEIEVELYKNGVLYETKILNQANDFGYTWNSLIKEEDEIVNIWTIKEIEVPGYTVSYEKDGTKITITNTHITPPDTPDPELPNTGVLWWPVPILLTVGIASMVIGHMRNKNEA